MKTSVQVPEGHILLTRDTRSIPDNFVACWANPNRTRWWQFWIPRYRYSYFVPKQVALTIDQDGDGDFWLYVDGYPFPLAMPSKTIADKMQKIYMENRGKVFRA